MAGDVGARTLAVAAAADAADRAAPENPAGSGRETLGRDVIAAAATALLPPASALPATPATAAGGAAGPRTTKAAALPSAGSQWRR